MLKATTVGQQCAETLSETLRLVSKLSQVIPLRLYLGDAHGLKSATSL